MLASTGFSEYFERPDTERLVLFRDDMGETLCSGTGTDLGPGDIRFLTGPSARFEENSLVYQMF